MKGNKSLLLVFLFMSLAVGTYSQARLASANDPNASAGRGQSEIIINAENVERDIVVWVNGTVVAHVPPKTREKIIVPDGINLVEAADTQIRSRQWSIGTKRQISVNSGSNRITIGLTSRYGALLSMAIQETSGLGGNAAPPSAAVPTPAPQRTTQSARTAPPPVPVAAAGSIENAVIRAAKVLEEGIPDGATLAIINVASADADIAEFVIEELTYMMVNARKYTVVDRKGLDTIMEERRFQYSGEVDDNSAVSIGKMLGASIVITGSITGSGSTRRLSAKALDVMTARIEAMAREPF